MPDERSITLAHGAGGELMHALIKELTEGLEGTSAGSVGLLDMDDGASVAVGNVEVVFTTDSYVVQPLFFPGGNIGKLAACGTINDLAVMGARPVAFSSAMVLEEGFSIAELKRITSSLCAVLREVNTPLVTGDTKIMEKGALSGMVINTSGIGIAQRLIRDSGLAPDDRIIITGTVGDHGTSLLLARGEFCFESELTSDCAPIWETVRAALEVGGVSAMKDPTRGGLASALNEMASKSHVGIIIEEDSIPMKDAVVAASELLGVDPLVMANEGKAVIGVHAELAEDVLTAIRKTPYGRDAAIIGRATEEHEGRVVMHTSLGGRKYVEMPIGDPVPRVC